MVSYILATVCCILFIIKLFLVLQADILIRFFCNHHKRINVRDFLNIFSDVFKFHHYHFSLKCSLVFYHNRFSLKSLSYIIIIVFSSFIEFLSAWLVAFFYIGELATIRC